eukprot:RCo020639
MKRTRVLCIYCWCIFGSHCVVRGAAFGPFAAGLCSPDVNLGTFYLGCVVVPLVGGGWWWWWLRCTGRVGLYYLLPFCAPFFPSQRESCHGVRGNLSLGESSAYAVELFLPQERKIFFGVCRECVFEDVGLIREKVCLLSSPLSATL